MPWLINAGQLDKFRKNQKNVIVLDASWSLDPGVNVKQRFVAQHIVGAKFFDITLFHDTKNTLPNMLTRDDDLIASQVGALGISNDHKIIFYDHGDLHTACRALWMFKVFGHNTNQLYILDGGYAAWEKYGGKIEAGEARSTSSKTYDVSFQSHFIRTLMQIKTNMHHPKEQIVDMRHPARYAGGKELRQGLRAGHIPKSFSFPYMTMFETDGRFKPLDKIRKQLTGIGVSLDHPMITMCGSGITSAILDFVLDLLNHNDHALYDGSWAEWGAEQLYPGEANLAERPVVTSLE